MRAFRRNGFFSLCEIASCGEAVGVRGYEGL